MDPRLAHQLLLTRRYFFGRAATGLGTMALASLLNPRLLSAADDRRPPGAGVTGFPNFAGKAKRVIYLFQSGAPSQMDLFDYSRSWPTCAARSCPIPFARASASPA